MSELAENYQLTAKHLRERARGVMDNERRRRMHEEADDVDRLADDLEEAEREKSEVQRETE